MIRSVKETRGWTVGGSDGDIGKIVDYYFDDDRWVIRYLVVETGDWLGGRRVLISPASLGPAAEADRLLPARLTRDQVRNGPDIDTARPISRQLEEEFNRYYRFPVYWGGDAIWGVGMTPGALAAASIAAPAMAERERELESTEGAEGSRLRSAEVVLGFSVQGRDGDAGRLDDLLFDDETYRINYMAIVTSGLLGGKKVTLPPSWVTQVDFTSKQITLDLNKETVKNSPDYDLDTLNQDAGSNPGPNS